MGGLDGAHGDDAVRRYFDLVTHAHPGVFEYGARNAQLLTVSPFLDVRNQTHSFGVYPDPVVLSKTEPHAIRTAEASGVAETGPPKTGSAP